MAVRHLGSSCRRRQRGAVCCLEGKHWRRPCFTETWDTVFRSPNSGSDTCIAILVVAASSANSLSEFPPAESQMRNPSLSCSLFSQPALVSEVKWGQSPSSSASPLLWPALPSKEGQMRLSKQHLDWRYCLLKCAVEGSTLCSVFLHRVRSQSGLLNQEQPFYKFFSVRISRNCKNT